MPSRCRVRPGGSLGSLGLLGSPLGLVGALVGALVGVLVLVACSDGSSTVRGEQIIGGGVTTVQASYRTPAPSLDGELLEGGRFDLSDYRGRVVVLNFWASWCAPCAHEAPMLKALSEEMAARGVAFVGVDVRDQKASATSFQARHGIRYPSLFDRSGATVLSFKRLPATPPSTVILDKQGRVAARVLGETSASTLRPLIDDVLAEAGP